MKAIFSVVVTCFLISNASADSDASTAQQVLLDQYNISLITDTCTTEGYEFNSTYPCYGENDVEIFAQSVLKKVEALQMKYSNSTIELRLATAWLFCFHSKELINITGSSTSMSFKVQGCNLDKTLQTLSNPEINISSLQTN